MSETGTDPSCVRIGQKLILIWSDECLGVEHHITLTYCPWANGGIEVVGKDLLWTCHSLLSEFRSVVDEWDLVLSLVEFVVNNRPRDVLGGRSVIEVVTGR